MPPRLVLAALVLASTASGLRADAFDRYTNPVLAKAPGAPGVQEVKELTPALLAANDSVLPDTAAALLVVKTNDNRNSKLLVQAAQQKVGERRLPILLIERFVTYREGEERTVVAEGKNIHLFDGFHFDLDLGQVVPGALGGDLQFTAAGGKARVTALGKARMYLVTKPLPGAEPRKGEKLVVGGTFEPRYFNGTYKLHDDGRRSGTLTLKVADDGSVTGAFYSDRDGRKYEVFGKLGTPRHAIQFTVKFPRSQEVFQGYLFTGDAAAIAGSARLQERETGFYATRSEE